MGDVVGGILGTDDQADAAGSAADAQYQASKLGIDEQKRQFDFIQNLLKPFVTGGTSAFAQQGDLIGTNGLQAQQAAINGIQNDPYFTSLRDQGENSILQNASATGGLRGGNVQQALSQFSPQLLGQFVQQKIANLGGLSGIGLNAATGTGTFGANSSNNISNLLQQGGAAQAGGIIAQGNQQSNTISNIAGIAGIAAAFGF